MNDTIIVGVTDAAVSQRAIDWAVRRAAESMGVKLSPDGKAVQVTQDVKLKCERISAAEYQQYRSHADAIARILDDELVLGAGKATAKAAPPKR